MFKNINLTNSIEKMAYICQICDETFQCDAVRKQHLTKNHGYGYVSNEEYNENKIEFKLPAGTCVYGRYMGNFKCGQIFEAIETPDSCHVIHLRSYDDCRVALKNPKNVDYSIHLETIFGGESKILACMRYSAEDKLIYINNDWVISDEFVENRFSCAEIERQQRSTVRNNNNDGAADLLLKIQLDREHFDRLGPNDNSTLALLCLNGGPWINISFNSTQLAFITKMLP